MTLVVPPSDSVGVADEAELLRPYVPRLVIEWVRSTPDALHRELDATLAFVDISGFTALTERLAKKGKIGAELMRDTLDGVFRALLDEAYEWGAGLLKWGGDALVLLFDGPLHEKRASRAAWEMQRTIDRVGRLHLSGGSLILRMSVGIGTGTFHFFMTGSVHRELLIAGPAMTETLQMEAIADAGEIGISPTLAARLDPACVGAQKGAAILLAAPPEVERRRAGDVGDVRGLDIPSAIPVAMRAHVLLKKSEPEHRTITAAFIDLMETDRLLQDLGAEGLGRGLDQRIRAIQEAALRYEVPFYETDVGASSVKALLTAGAPSSTGHDEERMLRTLREIMDQPGVVPMRIGVNTGKVFTGDFGPPYRRAYRVFGDAINTAARVMSKAEAGQILSTEIVLNRSRTVYETTPIEPFAAKGKAEPVRASIVGPPTGRRESHHGGMPLVGRDAELQTILEAIDAVRAGQSQLVEIAGEPGIGKTRLVQEVIARSRDFIPLYGRCEEYEASTPYYPIRAILRSILELEAGADAELVARRLREVVERVDPSLVPWIPLLGIPLGLDLPPTPATRALDQRFLRERLAEVVSQFLRTSVDGATILAIEDAHHMDEASRDLLTRLAGEEAESDIAAGTGRARMLLVAHQDPGAIFEADEGESQQSITVRLQPLAAELLAEIVDLATEDRPLHPHDVDEIARRSGGNALFLFELIDAVRETGTAESLPDSVEALIAGEIDLLAPTDRIVLRYAAVLGSSFDPELLSDVVGDDVDLDPDVWSRLSGLLQPEAPGSLRFRTSLIRDTAYEGLPYRRRRALHERVGETIEARAGASAEDEAGALALHYHEAQRWDKAWQYSRLAGDRALEIYANLEATRYFEKALTAGHRRRDVSADDLARLYEQSSDAHNRLGEFAAADAELKAARRHLNSEPERSALLVVKQAMVSARQGLFSQALLRVSRALHTLRGRRGRSAAAARAKLLVTYGGVRYLQNRRVESIEACRRAVRDARRAQAKDVLAQAYQTLDLALTENGEIDKATYSRPALQIFEELGDIRNQASTLNNLGLIAHARSEWDESRALYERSMELFAAIGDRAKVSIAKFNISEILCDQGRYDEAEPLLREVLRVWRAAGADMDVASAKAELGKLLGRRGDFEAAREMLASARSDLVRGGNQGEVLTTEVKIAEMLVLAGESDEAMAAIEAAAALAAGTDGGSTVMLALQRLRGLALMGTGQWDAAETTLNRVLGAARERDDRYEAALALDGLIRLRRTLGRADGSTEDELDAERLRLFEALKIVQAPTIPVPAAEVVLED
ncbi:MAG: tetratricopeptide repeat protein [Chloroflexota bacterium]|nr:tetratricopeptide repeat protein [Chloroflexota bacterium]